VLAEQVDEVRREGNLAEVEMLRRFEPSQRVHARMELSRGRWPRGREAGLDVMGDGTALAG
jgi:hypothetical protein